MTRLTYGCVNVPLLVYKLFNLVAAFWPNKCTAEKNMMLFAAVWSLINSYVKIQWSVFKASSVLWKKMCDHLVDLAKRMNVRNAKFGGESTDHPAMHSHLQTPVDPVKTAPPPPPYHRDMLMLQRWQYCTCNFYLWPPFCVSKIFTKKPGVHRYYSSRQKKKKILSQYYSNHCPSWLLAFLHGKFPEILTVGKNNAKEVFSGKFKSIF